MPAKSHSIIRKVFTDPFPFELFSSGEEPEPLPTIFITPLLGRVLFLEDLFFEKRFAEFFAARGFCSVLIHRPIFEYQPARGLEQIQEYIEESLKRNKAVYNRALGESAVDITRTGCFGISFGALISTLWATEEPRLKAYVLALGGGNLSEIFMRSRDPLMKSYRNAALTYSGFDKHDLKIHLQNLFTRDPLNEAAKLNPENTLLTLALFDRVIPFSFGKQLRDAIGNPKTIYLPFGHYLSIAAIPILKWQASKFFKEKLAQSA